MQDLTIEKHDLSIFLLT